MSNSIDTKTVTLRIEYDTDCESPLESCDGMWTFHEFSSRNPNANRNDFFEDRGSKTLPFTLDLFWKLRKGLAFVVGGVNDNIGYCGFYAMEYDPEERINGLIVWDHAESDMGATTYAERMKDADGTLDEYNKWAGGECYGFIFNDDEPDEDSCWGFIGQECLVENVVDIYGPQERPLRVVLVGDIAQYVFTSTSFGEGVEVMDDKDYREVLREEDASEADEMGDYDLIEREVA